MQRVKEQNEVKKSIILNLEYSHEYQKWPFILYWLLLQMLDAEKIEEYVVEIEKEKEEEAEKKKQKK